MSTFLLRVVTPDGEKFKGEAEKLFFKASDGDVGIMANHVDYIASVEICPVRIVTETEELTAVCGGGFITFSSNSASLVCDTFVFASDINKEAVKGELEEVEKKLLEAKNPREKGILTANAKRLRLYTEI